MYILTKINQKSLETVEIERELLPQFQQIDNESSELLALRKVHLDAMVDVLTGHSPKGSHVVRLHILTDTNCRSCIQEACIEATQLFSFCHTEVETSR